MSTNFWKTAGDFSQPLLATAIHDGHALRDEVRQLLALTDKEQRYEEDPYTAQWAQLAPNSLHVLNSRFEVDLNRPRESAVYVKPEDAWGLNVWKHEPDADFIDNSLSAYDAFYSHAESILTDLVKRHGSFVVFDLHTYNHMRQGPEYPPADPSVNPEINLGTGSMRRDYWSPVVDSFTNDLVAFDYFGRELDVRENVKFKGGHFSRWIHRKFPETGCAIAIEVKKIFMDEWTDALHLDRHQAVGAALSSTIDGVLAALRKLN